MTCKRSPVRFWDRPPHVAVVYCMVVMTTKKRKKAVKKSPVAPQRREDKTLKQAPIIRQVVGLLCVLMALFIGVHQFVDQHTGILGVLIEFGLLQAIGTLGFMVFPWGLLAIGGGLLFTQRGWIHCFGCTVTVCVAWVYGRIFFDGHAGVFPLVQLGYGGQFLCRYSVAFLGETGALLVSVGMAVMYMRVLFYRVLGQLIGCCVEGLKKVLAVVRFVYTTFWEEYRAIAAKRHRFYVTRMIHGLFFIKRAKRPSNSVAESLTSTQPVTPLAVTQPLSLDQEPVFSMDTLSHTDWDAPTPQLEAKEEVACVAGEQYDERAGDANNGDGEGVAMPVAVSEDDEADTAVETFIALNDEDEGASYRCPPIDLLAKGRTSTQSMRVLTKQRVEKAAILEEALASFNVSAKVVNITPGPTVTRYELQPGDGVKISKITALSKDIALKLAASSIRIEAPIPGKALVGVEVPNDDIQLIVLRSILEEGGFFESSEKLLVGLGKTITGDAIMMNLATLPHVLIAGATGSGKSVCINTIILSILMKTTPAEVKFLMIDPKKVELSLYEGIPHLIAPVVTDPNKAAATLKRWALVEMERRYDVFSKVGVKDIAGFNQYVKATLQEDPNATLPSDDSPLETLPFIVVIIDELADLMMVAAADVEQTICRLAQMARATGIHLVIATQRPSVNVVTGLIKANVPSRVSFYLQSQIDSRTILDVAGAEKLLGKGDMLYAPVGTHYAKRAQCVFVSADEVKKVVQFWKMQGHPDYSVAAMEVKPLEDATDNTSATLAQDALYDEAKQLILSSQYASTSYLQRKLRIGYNRAARIMDALQESGEIAAYVNERNTRS